MTGRPPTPEPVRFWAKVVVGDCWEWTASRTDDGYGQFSVQRPRGRTQLKAHRWAWEHLVGPIRPGLTLDHLCRNRGCVNPDHLQPASVRLNTMRGFGPSARNAKKQRCSRGHLFDGSNTYVYPDGARQCRTCWRSSRRVARSLARGAA